MLVHNWCPHYLGILPTPKFSLNVYYLSLECANLLCKMKKDAAHATKHYYNILAVNLQRLGTWQAMNSIRISL